jgi:hypothetical protein
VTPDPVNSSREAARYGERNPSPAAPERDEPIVRDEPVEVGAEATAITWRAGRAEEVGAEEG